MCAEEIKEMTRLEVSRSFRVELQQKTQSFVLETPLCGLDVLCCKSCSVSYASCTRLYEWTTPVYVYMLSANIYSSNIN
jgi:hypothetical protein